MESKTGNEQSSAPEASVIVLDWDDLLAETTSSTLEATVLEAFGPQGIGIVAIRNVPDFLDTKQRFLPLAHRLATLPSDYLETHLTDPDSLYNSGWSHGKEKLGDEPDLSKGSFYFNPVSDLPGTEVDRWEHPLSYPKNRWPNRISGFETLAKRVGLIMRDVVVELTRHLDVVIQKQRKNYPTNFLYNAMKNTDKVKGRLLYYFPLDQTNNSESSVRNDSWIGWHNDSGFLTALGGDLYVNHETGSSVQCPDPNAGLHVATRQGILRVEVPSDCIAVQMGECTQIISGGTFSATPHCVRGIYGTNEPIARISLPCFIDTRPSFPLHAPEDCSRQQVLDAAIPNDRVPQLGQRWTQDGMTFGSFLAKTFSLYYEWSQNNAND